MKFFRIFWGILYVALLYIYIHNPILPIGIGSCKLLYLLAFLYILSNLHAFSHYLSLFKIECIFLFSLICYSLFEYGVSGEFNTPRLHMVGFVEYFILPFFFVSCIPSMMCDKNASFEKYILLTGSLGAIITTLCILLPSFNESLRSTVNAAVYDSMDEYRAGTMYRGFGISEALTYSYGIIQGMFFVISLYYSKYHKWVLPFSILILLSAALNARTGLLIAAIGLLVYLLNKGFRTIFFAMILILLISLNIVPILEGVGVDTRTIEWLALFFEEADSVISNRSLTASNTTSYMFADMLIFPRDLREWIVGCGYDIYWSTTRRSDLGWIIQLNYGGIIYLFIEFLFLIYLFKRLKNIGNKTIALILAISFIVANTKGPVLPNSGIFRFIMLFYIYYIIMYYERKKISVFIKKEYKYNPSHCIG